ncbi:undecaprenyldiphospho-muramoylpentapeptide beta-N-acetylglucosaminyltransferase [Breznakia sp. OttesenSCG-928-G09]|nr:undecaprenyldiphospho-muramoylpentapeptide beta-N-acetylglucosaminyltransferase [Breznakia sp. OttesenSCG-928-G09]
MINKCDCYLFFIVNNGIIFCRSDVLKLLFVTGGTGGHIYPALALADYIKEEKQAEIAFVGNDDRMEKDIIPEHGYPFYALHTSGFSGNVFKKIKAGCQSLIALRKAKKIIKDFNPDVVIGFGGYVSVPVILAAQRLGKKIVLHEQNSVVGAANKMLAKHANAIVVCYERCMSELKEYQHVYLLGNPRASIAAKRKSDEAYFSSLDLPKDKPLVLIVMGSLGSSSITDIMKDVLQNIPEVNFLYVSGKQNYTLAKEELAYKNVKVVDYIDQLAIVDKFDLVICRAGATTAAEITASGVCSILIPSPYVAHNHQYFNAKALVDKKSALMIEEKDLNTQTLCDKINMVLNNPSIKEEIKKHAKENSFPNACYDITNIIERV